MAVGKVLVLTSTVRVKSSDSLPLSSLAVTIISFIPGDEKLTSRVYPVQPIL